MPDASAKMSLERRAVLLVNVHSRRGKELFEQSESNLRDAGVEIVRAVACKKMGQMVEESRAAIKDGVPMVIAGGGDGTFNSIASLFQQKETVLGVLPLGTGNSFARDLGIPIDLGQACQVIATGTVKAVDVGVANGNTFVNVATLGFSTRIAQGLTEGVKRKIGRLAYFYAVLKAWKDIQPFEVTIDTNVGTNTFQTLQVVIGNGRYHAGPFPLAPDASITSGHLSLYVVNSTNKSAFLRLALGLPLGHHVLLPEIYSESPTSGVLTTKPIKKVTLDGEIREQTPLKFSIDPWALKVLVPEDAELMH